MAFSRRCYLSSLTFSGIPMRLSVILPLLVDLVALVFLDTDKYQATGTTAFPYYIAAPQRCIPPPKWLSRMNASDTAVDADYGGGANSSGNSLPYGQIWGKAEAIQSFYTCMLALHDIIQQSGLTLREPESIMSSFNMLRMLTQRHYSNWLEYTVRLVSTCDQ